MPEAAARPLRILLAKLGMDTHTVGITVVAHALREAGMEVIFSSGILSSRIDLACWEKTNWLPAAQPARICPSSRNSGERMRVGLW